MNRQKEDGEVITTCQFAYIHVGKTIRAITEGHKISLQNTRATSKVGQERHPTLDVDYTQQKIQTVYQ